MASGFRTSHLRVAGAFVPVVVKDAEAQGLVTGPNATKDTRTRSPTCGGRSEQTLLICQRALPLAA